MLSRIVIRLSVTTRIVLKSYRGASNNVEALLALMLRTYRRSRFERGSCEVLDYWLVILREPGAISPQMIVRLGEMLEDFSRA